MIAVSIAWGCIGYIIAAWCIASVPIALLLGRLLRGLKDEPTDTHVRGN
jgi:hypothetical protein